MLAASCSRSHGRCGRGGGFKAVREPGELRLTIEVLVAEHTIPAAKVRLVSGQLLGDAAAIPMMHPARVHESAVAAVRDDSDPTGVWLGQERRRLSIHARRR